MTRVKTYTKFALSGGAKDTLVSAYSENCDCAGGTLRAGVGLCKVLAVNGKEMLQDANTALPNTVFLFYATIKNVFREYFAILTTAGKLYYYDHTLNSGAGGWSHGGDFEADTKPLTVYSSAGIPRTFFCNKRGVFYFAAEKTATSVEVAKPIGCAFEGRLFVAMSAQRILYSKTYTYDDFSSSFAEGGHVIIPPHSGAIIGLQAFENALYVFCEYGIFEMQATGSARDFVLRELEYTWGRIFQNSIGVCRSTKSGIYFLTENGVCAFDGKEIKRVCENVTVEPSKDTPECAHAEYNGVYQVNFRDTAGSKVSLVVDGETGDGYYTFVPMGLGSIHKRAYCSWNGRLYELCAGGNLPTSGTPKRIFRVNGLDFGERKRKSLHALYVAGRGLIKVRIFDGLSWMEKSKTLNGDTLSLRVNKRAKQFDLELVLGDGASVSRVSAEYETL